MAIGGFTGASGSLRLVRAAAFVATDVWTAMGWVRPTGVPATNLWRNVFTSGPFVAATSGISLDMHNVSGTTFWSVGTNTPDFDSTIQPALNTWTHLAIVVDPNIGFLRLYVNGVPEVVVTDPSVINGTSLGIGDDANNASWFGGQIGQVKFWKRLLGPTEIIREMRQSTPASWHDLYGWYPLEASASQAAYLIDQSGFGRNLTKSGGTQSSYSGPAIPPIMRAPWMRRVTRKAAAALFLPRSNQLISQAIKRASYI